MAKKKKSNRLPVLPVLLTILAGVGLALLLSGLQKDLAAAEQAKKGVAYLESLENKDPAQVDEVRNAIFQAKLDAERDEMIRQLNEGEVDPFTMFQDFVILGDSRAVGFDYFGFLDQDRVLAGAGNTIRNVDDNMDAIMTLKPSYIYMCYGLNDMSIGFWPTVEDYEEEFMEIINDLRGRLPGVTIIVSSILPAKDPAFAKSSKWRDIPAWNETLKAFFEENGVIFVDNSEISAQYTDLWETDGIHVTQTFYPYWAKNLIIGTLMGGSTNEIES